MWKEVRVIIVGLGFTIVFFVLDKQIETMPTIATMTGYIVGGLLIIYGVVCIFVPTSKIWEVLMSIRFRTPIFRKLHKKDEETRRIFSYVAPDGSLEVILGFTNDGSRSVNNPCYSFLQRIFERYPLLNQIFSPLFFT